MTTLTTERLEYHVLTLEATPERARSIWQNEHLSLAKELIAARAEIAELRKDAERYRWLRDLDCNHFYLTKNAEHAPNYMTAEEYLESSHGHDWCKDESPEEIQRMKDTNTIWCFQVYPRTPIGFDVWNRATLDSVIDAALAARGGHE